MKASDITDDAFLSAVLEINRRERRWAIGDEVASALQAPHKVVRAKARRLINRGMLSGCACGCRGDFEVPGWRDE